MDGKNDFLKLKPLLNITIGSYEISKGRIWFVFGLHEDYDYFVKLEGENEFIPLKSNERFEKKPIEFRFKLKF